MIEIWDLFGVFFSNHPDLRRHLEARGRPLSSESLKRFCWCTVEMRPELLVERRAGVWWIKRTAEIDGCTGNE